MAIPSPKAQIEVKSSQDLFRTCFLEAQDCKKAHIWKGNQKRQEEHPQRQKLPLKKGSFVYQSTLQVSIVIPVSDKKLVRFNDVGQCGRKMRGTVAGFAARNAWCRQKMLGSLALWRKGLDDSTCLYVSVWGNLGSIAGISDIYGICLRLFLLFSRNVLQR